MIKYGLGLVCAFSITPVAMAAIPKMSPKSILQGQSQSQSQNQNVIEALKMPLANRISALRKSNAAVTRKELHRIAKDDSKSLQIRWRAITATGRLYPIQSMKLLKEMAESPQWFLRNASVIAMSYSERKWAINWAKKLLSDPALVVRTSAVQTLGRLRAVEVSEQLWQELYSRKNYKGEKSLWIRKHIVETLALTAHRGQEAKFIQALSDSDKSLHGPAISGLRKIHKGAFASIKDQKQLRKKWLQWWNQGKRRVRKSF